MTRKDRAMDATVELVSDEPTAPLTTSGDWRKMTFNVTTPGGSSCFLRVFCEGADGPDLNTAPDFTFSATPTIGGDVVEVSYKAKVYPDCFAEVVRKVTKEVLSERITFSLPLA
jgi:hypothetical protein